MRKLAIILILISIGINLYSQSDTVIFSASGGFYEDSFELTLSNNNPENRIFYTINGNTPTPQSYQYTQPLHIDENLYSRSDIYKIENTTDPWYAPDSIQKCIVIRAAVFDTNGNCISKVATNSYFILSLGCNMHGLPVLSICSDSTGLFDYENGIMIPGLHTNPENILWTGNYFQKGQEWERVCNIEFYETNNTGINQIAGLRTHGNASRRYSQKSMRFYAREEYGKKKFNHYFFPELPFHKFKRLVIRPFRCSHWITSGVQDHISQTIARNLDIDVLASRPITVFLNGEYWGIYFLEESCDKHYISDHYEIDDDSCNIVKYFGGVTEEGNGDNWLIIFNWLNNVTLSDESNYAIMDSAIDISNFIDYEIFQIFSANFDWPANNVRLWQAEDRKWRCMLFDADGCFFMLYWDALANALSTTGTYPTNANSTLVLRKLLENKNFSERFVARFHQLVASVFSYSNTSIVLNSVKNAINDEIPRQCERFDFPHNYEQWQYHIDSIDNFLRRQPTIIIDRLEEEIEGIEHYQTCTAFSIFPNPTSDYINISISNTKWGVVRIDIFDLQGRTVYSDIVFCDEGENIHTIDIHNLPQGTYITRVGEKTQKVVKIQ
jgi:hypothetical protein